MKVTKFGRLQDLVSPEELQEENIVVEAKDFDDEVDEGTKEQMRKFAHQQLAKSSPHVHKKYKHYD